jgi:hypothetical protein
MFISILRGKDIRSFFEKLNCYAYLPFTPEILENVHSFPTAFYSANDPIEASDLLGNTSERLFSVISIDSPAYLRDITIPKGHLVILIRGPDNVSLDPILGVGDRIENLFTIAQSNNDLFKRFEKMNPGVFDETGAQHLNTLIKDQLYHILSKDGVANMDLVQSVIALVTEYVTYYESFDEIYNDDEEPIVVPPLPAFIKPEEIDEDFFDHSELTLDADANTLVNPLDKTNRRSAQSKDEKEAQLLKLQDPLSRFIKISAGSIHLRMSDVFETVPERYILNRGTLSGDQLNDYLTSLTSSMQAAIAETSDWVYRFSQKRVTVYAVIYNLRTSHPIDSEIFTACAKLCAQILRTAVSSYPNRSSQTRYAIDTALATKCNILDDIKALFEEKYGMFSNTLLTTSVDYTRQRWI